MRTPRNSTLQSMGMAVSFIVAAILTVKAYSVRHDYAQSSMAGRIEALPVIDAEVVMSGYYDSDDVTIASYLVGFAFYLIWIEVVLFIVLPNLYRHFRDRKRRRDLL